MTHRREHCSCSRAYVQLAERGPDLVGKDLSIRSRLLRSAETGHGERKNIAAGTPQLIHCSSRNKQCESRVKPARDSDDQLRGVDGDHAPHEGAHLDSHRLFRRGIHLGFDTAHEREASNRTVNPDIVARRRKFHTYNRRRLTDLGGVCVVCESVLFAAPIHQQVHVDVRDGDVEGGTERSGVSKCLPDLANQGFSIPRQIGGGLTKARRRIDVGR